MAVLQEKRTAQAVLFFANKVTQIPVQSAWILGHFFVFGYFLAHTESGAQALLARTLHEKLFFDLLDDSGVRLLCVGAGPHLPVRQ